MKDNEHPLWSWCIGKPICIGLAAVQVAAATRSVCELLRFVHREENAPVLARGFSIDSWKACYKRSVGNFLAALRFIPSVSELELPPDAQFRLIKRQMVRYMQMSRRGLLRDAVDDVTAEDFQFAVAESELLLLESIEDLDNESQLEFGDDVAAEMIKDINCRFYLEVTFPVIVEYQETPETLLVRAINRDWDALEKLCRIDKWVTRIPEIYRLEDSGNGADARAYEIATKPTKERPPAGQLDDSKVKHVLAALLSHSADLVGHRLSAKEIRDLFDIIAQRYNGQTRDVDLNSDDLNLAKAIQRHKKAWRSLYPLPPADTLSPLKEFRKKRAAAMKKHQRRKSA